MICFIIDSTCYKTKQKTRDHGIFHLFSSFKWNLDNQSLSVIGSDSSWSLSEIDELIDLQ